MADSLTSCRLFRDAKRDGAWNMAVDQLLLEQAAQGQTSLRFYEWSVPTLSLGYFQPHAQRTSHRESHDCPLVRRASGGGAIVHDGELTYSFAAPAHVRSARDQTRLYHILHETLVHTLDRFGVAAELCSSSDDESCRQPFLCFQRRTAGDVLVDGQKVAGSAQRRYRSAILQHGSVLLDRSSCAPQLAGIRQVSNVDIRGADLIARWLPELGLRLDIKPFPADITDSEAKCVQQLVHGRFANASWTFRR